MNLIFCDLDGTLEDSRKDMAQSVQTVRHGFGLDAGEEEDWVRHVNRGMEYLYRNCFAEMFEGAGPVGGERDLETLERIQQAYEADYLENVAVHTVLYPGIKEAVAELADVGTLALYTNKPEKHSRKLLLELEVSRYFRYIVGCDTFQETKPAPGPMRTIAADEGFDADNPEHRAFMIGDTAGDMQAARFFDATAIWCAWGYNAEAPVDPIPDYIAREPSQLIEAIHDASRQQ